MTTDTPPVYPKSQELIDAFKAAPDNRLKLSYRSNVEVAAKHKKVVKIDKYTEGIYTAGVDYASLPSVSAAVASGERGEVQSLPWGEWAVFPWIIRHKNTEYMRLYPVEGEKPTVIFTIMDATTGNALKHNASREEVAAYLTPANARDLLAENPLDCFTKCVNHLHIVP